MRTLRAFLVILLSVVTPGARAGARPTGQDARPARPSVVIVSAHVGYHRDFIGAGVIVAVGPYAIRVVSARHVVANEDVTVWIDGVGYPADVVRTFAHRDIAVVDALVPRDVRAHLAAAPIASAVDADERIVIWGEDDAGPRMERGRVVSTAFIDPVDAEAPPLVSIDCDRCGRGDSGGGIFSPDGSLIAILVARYRGSDRRLIATVGEYIDPTLFAPAEVVLQATATSPASTVRSQNDPKLSPE